MKCFGSSRMKCAILKILKWSVLTFHFSFSALFHLDLLVKFHSNSGGVSVPLKCLCVVYSLFVRKQWVIKLCISSTLNNRRGCLIRNWLYTTMFLPHNYCCKGEHPAVWSQFRKDTAFTHLAEEVVDSPLIFQLVLFSPLLQVSQSSSSLSVNENCMPCASVSVAVS